MKTNLISKRTSIFLFCLFVGLTCARASVLLYEGFDYTSGVSVSGLSGGTGWYGTGSWSLTGSSGTITNGLKHSLGWESGNAVSLNASSIVRYIDYTANGTFAAYRDGGNRLGSSTVGTAGNVNGTLYLSFLVDAVTAVSSDRFFLQLGDNGGGTSVRIGQFTTGGSYAIGNTSSAVSTSTITPTAGTTDLIVVAINFSSVDGGDSISYWVNPTSSSSTATGTYSGLNFTLNQITLRSVSGTEVFDEVSMGTSWSDVATVPEPVAMISFITGCLILWSFKRYTDKRCILR
jgi:hypothetical protein